jgi:hypothetical protein
MKKDIIFFWIPKTAGTSLYSVLHAYCGCPKLKSHRLYASFGNKGCVTFSHVDVFHLLKKGIITQDYYSKAFKFCFVRNPWDRLVSLYFHLKYDRSMSFSQFCDMIEKAVQLQDSVLGHLLQYVYNSSRLGPILWKLNRISFVLPLPRIGPYNRRGLSQANPQLDWITDGNGNIAVDFVGRYENLHQDYLELCRRIGVEGPDKLPRLNKSQGRQQYRDYYNGVTRELIRRIYSKDIGFFGYEF